MSDRMTSVYLACFHSVKRESLEGCGAAYRAVEEAIRREEWPYDNGDDPSFYVARRGGPLTWGVCRPDVRNSIAIDSIAIFFSYTPVASGQIFYRLCAVETVTDKLDHSALHRDPRFSRFSQIYSNGLIKRMGNGWRYDETDRPSADRHHDWLWRISNHPSTNRKSFAKRHASVYRMGRINDDVLASGHLQLARNYVVFSAPPDRAFISLDPPKVAVAEKGHQEQWIDRKLQELTVGRASSLHRNRRSYLRVANPSGRNVHRHIRVELPSDEAGQWREELILALAQATQSQSQHRKLQALPVRKVGC